jgi:integration host factor subunit alpha
MAESTVTRADIVSDVVTKTNVSRQQATDVLESVLREISKTLANGRSVKISSFGTFAVRKKTERLGRNPRTGVAAKISARQVISFKASPIFKKNVEKQTA